MGYTTKDIAVISEPKRVSLSALPNFVQFQSKPRVQTPYELNITILATAPDWQDSTYYNAEGVKTVAPSNINEKTSGPMDISNVGPIPFTSSATSSNGHSFILDASGAVLLTWVGAFSGTIPAGAKTLLLSNDFGGVEVPTFLYGAGPADLLNTNWSNVSRFNIIEPSGKIHSFVGTQDKTQVRGSTFLIVPQFSDTAENMRQVLLNDPWVAANFQISIPFTVSGTGALQNGYVINVLSEGYGADFNITIATPGDLFHLFVFGLAYPHPFSINNDSISGEQTSTTIALDVYVDPQIFLGGNDKPISAAQLGNFVIALSKSYSGDTLWFDVNAPFNKYSAYNLPIAAPGWFNTGTMRVFRFVARVEGVYNYAFYQSNALYVLAGYGQASDGIDMQDYVYVNEKIKLLTNKPRTIYVKGQTEYLNFILSDPDHAGSYAPDWTLHILYRAYTTTGQFIGEGSSDEIHRSALNMVNTCVLRIDDLLNTFPNAGIVKVSLARNNAIVSNDLEYTIKPAALHSINQFSFLNRLGGWDSFNFDAAASEDIKTSFNTYTKTITPAHTKGTGVETTYSAALDDVLTVVGAPVTNEVAEWLKEFAASTTVIDSEGNYIIKTEFTATFTEGAKNMQVPTLKYRISETYNNE
jgi:hypothetical protein